MKIHEAVQTALEGDHSVTSDEFQMIYDAVVDTLVEETLKTESSSFHEEWLSLIRLTNHFQNSMEEFYFRRGLAWRMSGMPTLNVANNFSQLTTGEIRAVLGETSGRLVHYGRGASFDLPLSENVLDTLNSPRIPPFCGAAQVVVEGVTLGTLALYPGRSSLCSSLQQEERHVSGRNGLFQRPIHLGEDYRLGLRTLWQDIPNAIRAVSGRASRSSSPAVDSSPSWSLGILGLRFGLYTF